MSNTLSSADYHLLQPHTVKLYGLEDHPGFLDTVNARNLLVPQRFDLFAKLFYIEFRQTKPEQARIVYLEHIKTFNPDGKEPGCSTKKSLDDFLFCFDRLIKDIGDNGFDTTRSLIPVGRENVILDGAHRTAILAYFNRSVTVCRFEDIVSKGPFDYHYFLNRGLSWSVLDCIALYATHWIPNLHIACLWPRIGGAGTKDLVQEQIETRFSLLYARDYTVSRKSLMYLISYIYKNQAWVGSDENGYQGALDKANRCFARNKQIRFLFFSCESQEKVLEMKDEIRRTYPFDKHSIHISDTKEEVQYISPLVLTEDGLEKWLYYTGKTHRLFGKTGNYVREGLFYLQHVAWINLKILVARLLKR